MSTPNLKINLAGLELSNPTILASGILGLDTLVMKRVADGGAGGITIKSVTKEPRKGHNNPILTQVESGFLNAVGYANKGIDVSIEEFKKWDHSTPLIGSIVATDAEEFAYMTERIQECPIKAIEIVLSCPHTPGYGLLAGQGTPEATAKITKAVRDKTKLPLSVKISPSIDAIGEIAKAAESEGASIINMGNTLGPGMKIDLDRGKPVLDFKVGGLSGPAIKPIMIRSVYDIYKAVKLPIIATGGITTGEDAIEAIMAGGSAVGIGTAIYYRGIDVFGKIVKEMEEWMTLHNVNSIEEIIGRAHL